MYSLAYVGVLLCFVNLSFGNFVFNVEHKYGGRESERMTLAAMKAHDERRHGRTLTAVDLPLGGDGSPTGSALYFTKIGLGTPSKDYHLQVDTGSDVMWVNCGGCDSCPKKSNLNIPLTLYNPKDSKTSTMLTCDQQFCGQAVTMNTCKIGDKCPYRITYGDGSKSDGYFVTDTINLNKAAGDDKTTTMNGSVAFGCAAKQGGQLGGSDGAVDGILGFGRANVSVLSQLASAGKVKKIFSHCLNSKGGGIFAIGELAEQKFNSTPFAPNMPHYNVMMTAMEVNGKPVQLASSLFGLISSGTNMVMDSGTTLAYLEDHLYTPLMKNILAAKPDIKLFTIDKTYTCFNYSGNIDEAFPAVTFRFSNSLKLTVKPSEYFFKVGSVNRCIGWQNSGVGAQKGKALNLLGDMVLANKLVVYNIENNTIGWTDYNCSSGVKMKDEKSGAQYNVASHDISPSSSPPLLDWGFASFLSMFIVLFYI